MAVSIFDHLECQQRKLLATRAVHNNDRVHASETQDSGHCLHVKSQSLKMKQKCRAERERGGIAEKVRGVTSFSS